MSGLGFSGPKKLNQTSNMPNMSGTLDGWLIAVFLIKTTQTIVDFERVDVETRTKFEATVQPLSARQLQLKPEGLRKFKWFQLHVKSGSFNLDSDDIIEYDGSRYKIMGDFPYELNGFKEYHMIEDFEDNG